MSWICNPTDWSARCLRQADRVLQVGFGDRPPAVSLEDDEPAANRPLPRVDFDPTIQSGLSPADRRLAEKHEITAPFIMFAWGIKVDFGRLARRITGRATGLVFSGGGARGFAHVGVIRAIEEAGIPIDMVGGTSMGALIGGALAAGMNYQQIEQVCRVFGSPRKILDYTFPLSSLVASKKVSHIYQETFGDLQIENLWTPIFLRFHQYDPLRTADSPQRTVVAGGTCQHCHSRHFFAGSLAG